MLYNYLKIALRSIWRNKVLAGINIFGLAVGIAACLFILLYVWNEVRYDRFHGNQERIVRATMEYAVNGEVNKVAVTGTKVAPAFSRVFPEVEKAVRLYQRPTVVKYQNQLFEEEKFLYADSTFFEIFSFKLIQGKPGQVLAAPNQVVLTQATARKYFGAADPVGKTLRINDKKDYTVTGVVEDVPANSQIKFDLVASFSSTSAAKNEQWFSANYYTYLLLHQPQAINSLQSKIKDYLQTQAAETGMTGRDYLTYTLEPLARVHLYSELAGLEPNSNIKYVYIFSLAALLILIIACTNYINLTIAHATERAKEVGIRKVMGAIKGQLFRQFIGESFIITLLGMLLSLGLVILLLPVFNQLTGKMLDIAMLLNPFTLAALVAIALVISLLAGSFPAVVLAGFKPIKVLKGNFKATGAGVWLRKSLLVFQFVISTCLIVSTLVIQLQLRYLQHKKIGYQNEQVLVLPADEQIAAQLNTFKNEFKSNAQVRQVSLAYETPTFIHGGYSYRRTEETKGKLVTAIPVEKDFIKTLAIPIVAGHDFTATDEKLAFREGDNAVGAYILNESAVRDLGYTSPEEAVGKTIHLNHKGVVKAVVKDFHYAPLHQPIGPLVIFLDELQGGKMLVKITPDDVPGTLQFLEAKWKALAPHRPFVYNFLDEEFGKLYNSEQRVGQFFSLFAFLAILLACLGLFGLAAFTTAQRAKEIGIRKVLGASVPNIVLLLSAGFLKLVLVANIIAWPLAWWAMHRWLQDFAYRIDISWWIFAVAGLGALVIALVTVSFKAFKVATANPVKSLRAD